MRYYIMDFNTITFPNWYRNFPEWWQQDKFLDAIGYFIGELGYYYAYTLLTAKLEQLYSVRVYTSCTFI